MIQETEVLQHLHLTPQLKDVKWIEMLVECAPKLKALLSLTINCNVQLESDQPVAPDDLAIRPAQPLGAYSQRPGFANTVVVTPETRLPSGRDAKRLEEVAKAKQIHDEFLRHADVFREAFPDLQRLQIDQGTFSLSTADLFPYVRELHILGSCSLAHAGKLSSNQLQNLTEVRLEKLEHDAGKIAALFEQFCEAPQLRKVKADMNGMNPLPVLSPFFTN